MSARTHARPPPFLSPARTRFTTDVIPDESKRRRKSLARRMLCVTGSLITCYTVQKKELVMCILVFYLSIDGHKYILKGSFIKRPCDDKSSVEKLFFCKKETFFQGDVANSVSC